MTREQFITKVESGQKAFRRFLTGICCGDKFMADDIAQDAYLKAYLAFDTLEDETKFNAWLYRIGYNTFISHSRQSTITTDYAEAMTVAHSEPDDNSELYRALDRLSPKERMVVLLFYMEDLSVKEIAEITQATSAAVRQQLTRARIHLRQLLSTSSL